MDNLKKSSNKNFGIVFFIFFLLISLYPLIYQQEIRIWTLIISFIFLILGLFNSSVLTPLNLLWFKFGILLGKLISPIIMGLVFFLVVTPIGLIMRLFKKDLLKLKKNNSKSYWIERSINDSNMKNQF